MSFYTWRERCHGAYRAEAATGLTHAQIIAFLQPGAVCPWEGADDDEQARAAMEREIHDEIDALRALADFNAGLGDAAPVDWFGSDVPF